jgi:hypothetical protein
MITRDPLTYGIAIHNCKDGANAKHVARVQLLPRPLAEILLPGHEAAPVQLGYGEQGSKRPSVRRAGGAR